MKFCHSSCTTSCTVNSKSQWLTMAGDEIYPRWCLQRKYFYYSHPLDCHPFCTWHIVMSARRSRRTSQLNLCIRVQIRQIISGMATHSPNQRFWNTLHPRCMMNRDHLARLTIHQQPSSGESILKFLIITGYFQNSWWITAPVAASGAKLQFCHVLEMH